MTSDGSIIVLTASESTSDAVGRALAEDQHLTVTNHCNTLSELIGCLDRKSAAGVVVDVDPRPADTLAQLAPVVARFPEPCFVLVSEHRDENILLEAMAIGARHFMLKESMEDNLARVFRRLLARALADGTPSGQVITVLSSGGGCGATTLAVNMANELCLAEAAPVLLVDMDTAYGAVADYLNLTADFGIADVLAQAKGADMNLISSTATPYAGGFDVLLSPISVNPAAPMKLSYEGVGDVLGPCRQAYPYILFDAPRVAPTVAATLAKASQAVFIIMQLTVKDVRVARELRTSLIEMDVPPDRIHSVVNRYRKKFFAIGLDEVKRALGCDSVALVSSDFRHAARSIDLGRPLASTAPMSSLRKDIQKLLTTAGLKTN